MPELPEVETVVNNLKPILSGKKILRIEIAPRAKKNLRNISLRKLNQIIKNKEIINVSRFAKLILIELESGIVAIHLRMTGRLIPNKIENIDKNYITAKFSFKDNFYLFFKDVRRFGTIDFYKDISEISKSYGVEPLSKNFTSIKLYSLLHKSKKNIKAFLLDQTKIVGIGNIYADEILWAAKINPKIIANSITKKKAILLTKAIKSILKKSIKYNGTTFINFYYGNNNKGDFLKYLQVFGKNGVRCKRCTSHIIKTKVAGRGTYICPTCQKMH